MNLLSNAFKYTQRGGDIRVSLTRRGDAHASLIICDSGIGIPIDQQAVIFERFCRVDDSGEDVPGAGIGLALVSELVEALDGTIDLESMPGEGTTISVTFPRLLDPGTQLIVSSDTILSQSTALELEYLTQYDHVVRQDTGDDEQTTESILIIEDNRDMQNYLIELLSPLYSCIVAGDGETGMQMGLEQIPDLVLCDVMLPKMDGYKVSQVFKSDERTCHIPIIMLTARGDSQSRIKGLREKVDDYLAKPFDEEELLLRIRNVLDSLEILQKRFADQMSNMDVSGSGLGKRDRRFLKKLNQIIADHLSDPKFRVEALASRMAISERPLQRKLKALTGHTAAQYLRACRLRKSLQFLRDGLPVSQAAERVGFSSSAYFTSCFRQEFGESPTKFANLRPH